MTDVAIVGMGCRFPGAPDLATYWENVCAGVDAVVDVPPERVDPAFFESGALYCRRGGFVDTRFDATRHGIMPVAARGSEPDQLLALDVATAALRDAGYDTRPFARERAGVVLGRGGYAGPGRGRLSEETRGAEQLVTALRALVPSLTPEQLAAVGSEFRAAVSTATGADAAIGLVPNLAASRIAHRLDLHGPAFTVDAACASALVAVDHACVELGSGRSDLMLAGGVHLCQDEAFWSVFCRLGALSRNATIRPFDRRADGLVIGEGIGVVVLKRRVDAERDGDRIYAIIRGTGIASDGRHSLMSPAVEGQVLALERAWADAQLDPSTIALLEAHGTATPAGDAAELETLRRVFGEDPTHRAVVGSVKSMIGHTMPAAGAAGLIKAALAAHHGILPPTLHCEDPNPALATTRFRTLSTSEPWPTDLPRRAAVNAFGFGGINAHIVLDGIPDPRARERARAPARARARARARLFLDRAAPGRLALLDPTPERLARAKQIVAKGRPWHGREEIWFSPSPLLAGGGKLVFAFPGVDATATPRVDEICSLFDLTPPTAGPSLEERGRGIIEINRLFDRALSDLGIRPDAVMGHSIGEWSAMIAAGVVGENLIDELGPLAQAGALAVPGVLFGAAGCGRDKADSAMAGLPSITLSHDNCPHQVILCGVESSLDIALSRLRAMGVLCEKLPFASGFHTPLFAGHVAPHRERFARIPMARAKLPLYSATRVAPYPDDEAGIRALAVEHLLAPVRFRELALRLHDDGARVFVQVGTGSLTGFLEDSLRGRPHLAVSASDPRRGGVDQLVRMAAALFVEGLEPRFDRLLGDSEPQGAPLALGVPLWRPTAPLHVAAAATPPAAISGRLGAAFQETLGAIGAAGADVLAALAPREKRTTRTLSMATMPALVDHCFFRQPVGWPTISDRHPVVPMTALLELMIDAARELCPGRVPVAVEDARAMRWLVTSKPVNAKLHSRLVATDRVAVTLEGYADATVTFAAAYPAAPPPSREPMTAPRPVPFEAADMYRDRWMFHGPAYQGVRALAAMGDDGLDGTLECGAAPGALLDNAGQIFGLWVMLRFPVDRLAMPVAISRLSFHAPHPQPGARVECQVRIRRHDDRAVVADLELVSGGRVWARIEGWEDRRFETDERLWNVFRFPERHLLAVPRGAGAGREVVFQDRYRGAPTREQLERRFLGERERADYEAQPPRSQRAWLAARIAAKDAVRDHLWAHEVGPLFPVEIELSSDGKRARWRGGELRVDTIQDGDLAIAAVKVLH